MAALAPVRAKAASRICGVTRQVCRSTSTSAGLAPAILIADAVAGNVKAGVSTGPVTPRTINGAANATVPLEAAMQAVSANPQRSASLHSRRRDNAPKLVNQFAS